MANERTAQAEAVSRVAVVVPAYNRTEFTSDEDISFRHLEHFLGRYDKYLVVPQSLDIERPGYRIQRFADSYFGSANANTRLMLSPLFYEAFKAYEYILIYQLDALVFSDQLIEWCDTGLDYIGSPWMHSKDSPWVSTPRVGNGGFSLRKVPSFLKVLSSDRYWIDPEVYWQSVVSSTSIPLRWLYLPWKWFKYIKRYNGVAQEVSQWYLRPDGTRNEDHFWSTEAVRYDPDFKVASFEEGLRFGFEVTPQICFELNQRRLPFGCHAWPRYDRSFWEPHLIKR